MKGYQIAAFIGLADARIVGKPLILPYKLPEKMLSQFYCLLTKILQIQLFRQRSVSFDISMYGLNQNSHINA